MLQLKERNKMIYNYIISIQKKDDDYFLIEIQDPNGLVYRTEGDEIDIIEEINNYFESEMVDYQ